MLPFNLTRSLERLLLSLCLHGYERVMVTRTEFHFAVLLSCCFRAMKRSNHHLRLSSGSTISKQDLDDHLVIQPVLLLLYNLP